MAHLKTARARHTLSEIVKRAAYGKERVIVSRGGKDLAAVIPIEDLRLLERLVREVEDRLDIEEAQAALEEANRKGTIPLSALKEELGH